MCAEGQSNHFSIELDCTISKVNTTKQMLCCQDQGKMPDIMEHGMGEHFIPHAAFLWHKKAPVKTKSSMQSLMLSTTRYKKNIS